MAQPGFKFSPVIQSVSRVSRHGQSFPMTGTASMARNTGRTVYLRSDGRWANKANDALKASDLHDTQDEARAQANQMLADAGGGDLTIKDDQGNAERHRVAASSETGA